MAVRVEYWLDFPMYIVLPPDPVREKDPLIIAKDPLMFVLPIAFKEPVTVSEPDMIALPVYGKVGVEGANEALTAFNT